LLWDKEEPLVVAPPGKLNPNPFIPMFQKCQELKKEERLVKAFVRGAVSFIGDTP